MKTLLDLFKYLFDKAEDNTKMNIFFILVSGFSLYAGDRYNLVSVFPIVFLFIIAFFSFFSILLILHICYELYFFIKRFFISIYRNIRAIIKIFNLSDNEKQIVSKFFIYKRRSITLTTNYYVDELCNHYVIFPSERRLYNIYTTHEYTLNRLIWKLFRFMINHDLLEK